MRTELKAAIAGTVGVTLLLGGAGTLAYWNDAQDVGTANIDSGSITLSAPTCTGTGLHGWQLDGGAAFTPGVTLLAPGDTVTKVCDMTLTLAGEHIGATLGIDPGGFTAAASDTSTLAAELTVVTDFLLDGGTYAPITAPGTYTVRATITVNFDGPGATNDSQVGDVNLDAIMVTATQTHG